MKKILIATTLLLGTTAILENNVQNVVSKSIKDIDPENPDTWPVYSGDTGYFNITNISDNSVTVDFVFNFDGENMPSTISSLTEAKIITDQGEIDAAEGVSVNVAKANHATYEFGGELVPGTTYTGVSMELVGMKSPLPGIIDDSIGKWVIYEEGTSAPTTFTTTGEAPKPEENNTLKYVGYGIAGTIVLTTIVGVIVVSIKSSKNRKEANKEN